MEVYDFSDTVTIKDLQEIFGVTSETTIWKWRKNTDLDDCGIRIVANKAYFVRFKLDCVLKWARRHNKATPGLAKWKETNKPAKPAKKKRVRVHA